MNWVRGGRGWTHHAKRRERLLREHIRELCGERRSLSFRLASPPSSSSSHTVCNCSIEVEGGGDHILGGIFGGWFESQSTDMVEGRSVGEKHAVGRGGKENYRRMRVAVAKLRLFQVQGSCPLPTPPKKFS